jgi:hypothetical protein
VGALSGIVLWWLWERAMNSMPVPARFVVAFAVFIVGPGAAVIIIFRHGMDALERWAIPPAVGLVLSAALAELLGQTNLLSLFPLFAASLSGGALVNGFMWRQSQPAAPASDVMACLLAGFLGAATGAVAYAHRTATTPDGIVINGDYDTFDSTYYAAISAELAHRIPPEAPFRAGHRLGYSYHSQLIAAMLHRFGGVPLIDLYFAYLWPAYLTVASITLFATVRRIASRGVALLATALVLLGSDLSYIAAPLRPFDAAWDRIIWSNNWMTPGAELLFFNTWAPALAVLLLAVWMFDRYDRDRGVRWLFAAGACIASLVQFKPFAYVPVMGGLVVGALIGSMQRRQRRPFVLLFVVSLALSLPYLYAITNVYEESQAVLRPGIGYYSVLPHTTIMQVGLQKPLAQLTSLFGDSRRAEIVAALILSIPLFVFGGSGVRLLGWPAVWRTLRSSDTGAAWRLLAYTIVAGALSPLFVVTQPYHQTFNMYQATLYLLWLFVASEAVRWTRGSAGRGVLIVTAILAIAVPSTVHYLRVKWGDYAFAGVNEDTHQLANRLRLEDPERTVLLHRYPQGPSFLVILAGRRTVLAWASYSRGMVPVEEEIDYFFQSAERDPMPAWQTLRRHHVTHIVETVGRDRIHPLVLQRLHPVLSTPTLRLYAVPGDEGDALLSRTAAPEPPQSRWGDDDSRGGAIQGATRRREHGGWDRQRDAVRRRQAVAGTDTLTSSHWRSQDKCETTTPHNVRQRHVPHSRCLSVSVPTVLAWSLRRAPGFPWNIAKATV